MVRGGETGWYYTSADIVDVAPEAKSWIRARIRDAQGNLLQASEGVTISVSDPAAATVWGRYREGHESTGESTVGTDVQVRGERTGSAMVTVQVDALALDAPIRVW